MKVEVLYPEVANLYGELGNIRYLKASVENAGLDFERIDTNIGSRPAFLDQTDIDLVYMGTMTENSQRIILAELAPVLDDFKAAIERGQHFLITGNALELFGSGIKDLDPELLQGRDPETKCLGVFPFHTERKMLHRFNSLYIGQYTDDEASETEVAEGVAAEVAADIAADAAGDAVDVASDVVAETIDVTGFKSQFTQSYYDGDIKPLFTTEKGPGFNPDVKEEGIHYKNFMATYIIGPLLIVNPLFTKALLAELGLGDVKLAFEDAAMDAFNARIKEYREPDRGFYY
ncbi:MAG: hypothetical protein PUB39_04660 [Eubacteriales bacterium]|nr:hypothetical protein [Eubacteriales bacterium]